MNVAVPNPGDEAPHVPGRGRWWSEAWHLDAARADGAGLTLRLDLYPNQDTAWFWAYLVMPDLPGPVVVRDHEVPRPRQGLEVRAEGLWSELWCETPLEHWTYGLEAFGVRLDDPADALHGEIGERIALGLDLEWEVRGPLHARPEGASVAGYVVPGTVHGEVLLGRSRFELDASAEWRHTWGDRDWFGRSAWSCGFAGEDLVVHVSGGANAVDGFVWTGGETAEPVGSATVETHRGTDGLPVAARYVIDDAFEVDVEVRARAPVPITAPDGRAATLARALCQYTFDGVPAVGWSTWLDPR